MTCRNLVDWKWPKLFPLDRAPVPVVQCDSQGRMAQSLEVQSRVRSHQISYQGKYSASVGVSRQRHRAHDMPSILCFKMLQRQSMPCWIGLQAYWAPCTHWHCIAGKLLQANLLHNWQGNGWQAASHMICEDEMNTTEGEPETSQGKK